MKINTLAKDIMTTFLIILALGLTLSCVTIGAIKYDLLTFIIGIVGFYIVSHMINEF